jgi:putative photosynthetic complex assembly protein 2
MSLMIPALVALAVWWLSTGLILKVIGPEGARGQRRGMFWASVFLVVGMAGVVFSRTQDTALGAYCAFVSAVMVWAWQEIAFLLGLVTGPNRSPCPPVQGWRRAWFAFTAIAHHELALLILGLAVLIPTIDAPNPVAWQTWLVLWSMRLSAKLNIFLGVQNFYEAFLPPSLHYLFSYFTRRRFNLLFPFSIAVSVGVTVLIWSAAVQSDDAHQRAAMGLLGSLMVLAIIEHALLIAPMQPERLWRWAVRSRG